MFKILVVEDDINTRKLMCTILQHNGYRPIQAADGIEALNLMEQQHIDLVIVDLMMPNMNGYELTKLLRTSWNNLPVFMITAKQEPQDRKKGFIVGTDDYMTKPVDEEEMIIRIKALLRRAQIVNDHKIIIGDITLDYDSLTLKRKNEVMQLPQKEFQLLFKLLAYPNIIFTRIQLMDELWGIDTETDDHTLNVHINRLREKTRNWPEFKIITVRGLGYKAVRNL